MRYQSLYLSFAVVCIAAACSDRPDPVTPLGPAPAASVARGNGGAPVEAGWSGDFDWLCPGMTVRLEVGYKEKWITVGKDGAFLVQVAPRDKLTQTNLATGKSVTLALSAVTRETVDDDGNVVTTMLGRTLAYDPVAEPHWALIDGAFTFVMNADGDLVGPRSGKGSVADACALVR